MPSPAQITRLRQRRQERASHLPGIRAGLGCSTLLSLLALLAGVAIVWVYVELIQDLPSLDSLPTLLDPPYGLLLQPTRLYDRSGSHLLIELQNPAAEGRQFLSLDTNQPNYLPSSLISATLAVSDPTFWRHPGYTLAGLTTGDQTTLAERLVSNLLLWDEPKGIRRAIRERLLAAQITTRYGRERVLTWYLNSANFGRLTYGADAAAHVYFGKPAAKLNLAEAALLAAVMQSPALNPLDAPKVARERAEKVIQDMLEGGWINASQAAQARKIELAFQPKINPPINPAPAFINLVLEQLGREFNLNRLEQGGFTAITTLDYGLQIQADCAMQTYIAHLEGQPEAPKLDDGIDCQAAKLLPTALPKTGNPYQNYKGNVVILDHLTGQVLSMVGEASPGLDPSHSPGHPPGSLLTPFIYLTGFTRGLSPASLVWDIPVESEESLNLDGKYHGPLRLRTALVDDDLAPAEQVLSQVGADNVWQMARQLGLGSSSLPEDKSSSALLQEGEVTLLDITRAYGVFAHQGILTGQVSDGATATTSLQPTQAITILHLEDTTGKPVAESQTSLSRPVISSQLAYLMTHILSDEPARWSTLGHPNPLEIGRPFAAKLGRTTSQHDAWAIGSTPYLSFGIWLGFDEQPPQGKVSIQDAASLLHALAQYASRELPPDGWPTPPGINTLAVCDPSGMLPTPECPTVVNEIFLAGNEPTQADTLYRKLQINRETGLLATVFTPPELVEERVYLIVPPEAQEWARQAGLPTPPDTYDVILANAPPSPDAQVSSPAMFVSVRGKVTITGTAGGDGFELYRLQVGQGLNPQRWIQVGQEVRQPVIGGELGEWDTQGLSGLYALQLLVVHKDQRVETDTIQVTVDNQPPKVTILYPTEGQEIPLSPNAINLQAQVSDDLALKVVEFYVDNSLIDSLTQGPFTISWRARQGMHTFRVIATDQAGNSSQEETTFRIK